MNIAIQFADDPKSRGDELAVRRAQMARQALVAEAELTPKPGLVDRRGNGSHADLSLAIMRRSADSLAPYFASMSRTAQGAPLMTLRASLAAIGRDAESAMLRATGGSNAHKGAIWSIGLLLSAHSMDGESDPLELSRIAGAIARMPDRARPFAVSHGRVALNRYGALGARGEACADFPHITRFGLPALRLARGEGRSETVSRLCALLQISAHLQDTCVLYRGGREGQRLVQDGSRRVMSLGGPATRLGQAALRQLDHALVARRVSPGGAADLLAATLLLDAVERNQTEVTADQSLSEDVDGAYAI